MSWGLSVVLFLVVLLIFFLYYIEPKIAREKLINNKLFLFIVPNLIYLTQLCNFFNTNFKSLTEVLFYEIFMVPDTNVVKLRFLAHFLYFMPNFKR